eukprot:scaffold567_cov384-Prasinococcus_capsulatus_cf.AAC.12
MTSSRGEAALVPRTMVRRPARGRSRCAEGPRRYARSCRRGAPSLPGPRSITKSANTDPLLYNWGVH